MLSVSTSQTGIPHNSQSTDLASVVGDNYIHMNCFSEEFREYEAMSLLGNSLNPVFIKHYYPESTNNA